MNTPYRATVPGLDGKLADWEGLPVLRLGDGSQPEAQLRSAYDGENLYLALSVPAVDAAEAKESGFSDEVQIGMAERLSDTDFGGDILRLGFNSDSSEARDRTPGHKPQTKHPLRRFSRCPHEALVKPISGIVAGPLDRSPTS